MDRTYFSVLAIGGDSPGIVAAISGVLADRYSSNIETSQMTIVAGLFAVALIASRDVAPDFAELTSALEEAGDEPGVRKVAVSEIEDFHSPVRSEPVIGIMAHATDRAGVLHEIADALASRQINVTSLSSLCTKENASLCTINLDVVLPDGMKRAELEQDVFNSIADDISLTFRELPPRQRR